MFRIIVQDSRLTPTSGKVVAQLGSFDPHAKSVILDKEKAAFYLEHGAQPSDRLARLLKNNGVELPSWVKLQGDKARKVKNIEKRRSTAPAAPKEEAPKAEVPDVADETLEAEAPATEKVPEEAAKSSEPTETVTAE